MLVFWYFVLENTAPPVVKPPDNGGFVLMKHSIQGCRFTKMIGRAQLKAGRKIDF